ncbi:MAG: hypothetical protein IID08_10060, partial [Candidatus Hydrogenedentes bacterium]|nr:hypothetical protein [Candidatus Hydrogenedentota bacterium]
MSGRTRRKRRGHEVASPRLREISRNEENRVMWRHILAEPFAIGLAVFVFFRPWRDGMTFVSFNFYFAFFVFILSAVWLVFAVRTSRTSPLIVHRVPAILLLTYLAIAFLSALDTVQYDATYRALILWSGHVALFLLCCNALRSERAIGIVLGAFVVTALANNIWSIIHLQYVLPLMREQLSASPEIAYQFFRMREMPPELQHRLEMNRAFGTFLHPNALAAFLVLGIPYFLGELGRTVPQWI